jgi:hypothetical protein
MVSSASVPIVNAALSEDHTIAEGGSNNPHNRAFTLKSRLLSIQFTSVAFETDGKMNVMIP